MKVAERVDGSVEVGERWTLLRYGALLGAIAMIALVIPSCFGPSGCDRKPFHATLIVAPLLIALGLWIQDATFLFDKPSRSVRWTRRRLFGTRSGEIPFDAIVDVQQRARSDPGDARYHLRYRLALVTRTGDVYLSIQEALRKSDDEGLVALIRGTLGMPAGAPVRDG